MQGRRYGILDGVRGFTVLSMVLYHACWDLVHLAGRPWDWFQGTGAYVWQQSICWVFIFLAGLCFNLGRRHVRRGLELLSLGAIIMGLTWLCLPQDAIFFGILFFLGAATLITVCLKPLLVKLPAVPGLGLSALLFVVLRNVNSGTLGFETWQWLPLPAAWYELGYAGSFLGFTAAGFRSADYFPLLPWLFLYLTGYFAGRNWLAPQSGSVLGDTVTSDGAGNGSTAARAAEAEISPAWCRSLQLAGRHALGIYLVHQPLLLVLLWLLGS